MAGSGNLDAYSKIDSEKKRFAEEKNKPKDSPVQGLIVKAENRKNAAIQHLSKKYVAGLNAHKIALMKSDNIEGAKDVQTEIDRVKSGSMAQRTS